MENFEYCNPTRLIFGKGVVDERLTKELALHGKRVLLAYGGGSIKRSGLYDLVLSLTKDFEVYELSGIEPNPKYSTSVVDGVRICKEKQIDVILSVGGGSVLDCCKAIAGGAKYDGETWDLIIGKAPTLAALPIVDIMTLAATGSEYDFGGVISRTETNDKLAYMHPLLAPACSFLDPTYTFTVNAKHTAAGVADAFNHICEQYFTSPNCDVTDGLCETLFKTLIKYAPIALVHPGDYKARAELMYACTFGCNGSLALGAGISNWPMHSIEHALSAYYDITHGEGLAIITPWWMRHVLNGSTLPRFVKFGINVFGIDASLPEPEIARQAIDATARFFVELGIPMRLRDVGIDESRLREMAEHVAAEGLDNPAFFAPLTADDIYAIYKAAL